MSILKRLSVICVIMVLFFLAGCGDQPAYMSPYGDGVDPATVTTVPFQTRTTTVQTAVDSTTFETTTTTAVVITPQTAPQSIPEGYILCPLCQGIRVVCEKCLGSMRMKAEILDEASGIYVRKYVNCSECVEDPGFAMCEVCHNNLMIPD